jgi:hypothetical protein
MVNTLKLDDRLEGATDFRAWKARVVLLLEENDLKDYVESVVVALTNHQELATHKKKEVKAKRDHLETHCWLQHWKSVALVLVLVSSKSPW